MSALSESGLQLVLTKPRPQAGTEEREHPRARTLSIGGILPLLLGAVFAIDVAMRFLPTEWFVFRPHEAMTRFAFHDGPFAPNRSVAVAGSWGDLATVGNQLDMREIHPQRATSDRFGFRNAAYPETSEPVDVLLTGDSFSLGTSNSDEDTLASQLSLRGGWSVYNIASQQDPPTAAQIVAMARRVRVRPGGVVVVQQLERKESLQGYGTVNSICIDSATPAARIWQTALRALKSVASDARNYSPLQILARRAHRRLENDQILPNASARAVLRGRLQNDDEMLFSAEEAASNVAARDTGAVVWTTLAKQLRRDNLRMMVLLVPNKLTVYGPLLRDKAAASHHLDQLEASLRAAGLLVVNPTALLRARAAELAPRREYLYWRDDTHWNARGIRIAADLLTAELARRQ